MSEAEAQEAMMGVSASAEVTPLLRIRGLETHFPIRRGLFRQVQGNVRAVDGVDLDVAPGETVGLVGESGCGKSTLGRTILRLIEPTAGEVCFDGIDLARLSRRDLALARRDLQPIFQDPVGSLNPRMTVRQLIAESLLPTTKLGRAEREERIEQTLASVGLTADVMDKYPHEFSGGQRQRIAIAAALVVRPRFIVADEPVSALDVSVQSQVLNLLAELRREFSLTYLFIAHDLAVVDYFSDRVAVMYLGRIVELGTPEDVRTSPQHPYTRSLLSAIPEPEPGGSRQRIVLSGDVPSPIGTRTGCGFASRCPIAQEICRTVDPALSEIAPGRAAACHFPGQM